MSLAGFDMKANNKNIELIGAKKVRDQEGYIICKLTNNSNY